MYSSVYIPDNYAVNISCVDKEVKINVGKIKVKIINDYKVAIRVCELKNLFKSLGVQKNFDEDYREYRNLMDYIKSNNCTITDILVSSLEEYQKTKEILSLKAENHIITESFDKIRYNIINELLGNISHFWVVFLIFIRQFIRHHHFWAKN